MVFKQKIKNNILKLFFITFSNSFILAYVIERIFALERGLNILEMQYILIIYSATCLLLEVPFGVLADKWEKKYVLALGIFFCSFEFFISIYAYNFTVFSLAFLLAAVGGSLKSGTMDSILFQTLKELQRDQEYEKLKGYLKFSKYLTGGLAGIIGGYVAYNYGLVASYWLSLIGLPLAAIISLTLYEPKTEKMEESDVPRLSQFYHHIIQSIQVVRGKPILLQVILYGAITGAVLYGQLHEMSSIIYPDIGISLKYFGYISFTITLAGAIAGITAYTVRAKLGYTMTFATIQFVATITIFMYSLATDWYQVAYIILAIFIMEMITPLTSGYLHHQIEDRYRVTISSLDAFVKNAVTILVSLLFGLLADHCNIYVAFKMLAFLLLIYGFVLILVNLRLALLNQTILNIKLSKK